MLSFVEITQKIIKSRNDRQINENFSKENFSNMSLFDAYSIQKGVIDGLNKRVSGWKLGGTNTKTRNLFNVDELYWGPVFNGCITTNPQDIELYCGEVEIALKLNKNIQSIDVKVDPENLPKYIDSVALAIEYPQSFISNISEFGVQALISDCCGSGQCLISREMPFLEFINGSMIDIKVNSITIEKCSTDFLIGGLHQVACDFINNSIQLGFKLNSGQWLFTGGLSECRVYDKNSRVKISGDNVPCLEFYTG
jgi:2-keto-4-pentenoate hydratase